MATAVALMAVAAAIWLSYEFWRLIGRPSELAGRAIYPGGVDLRLRVMETRAWFRGEDVYQAFDMATYPPASYVLLWPLTTFPTLDLLIAAWTLSTLIALAAIVVFLLNELEPGDRLTATFVALIPLSMYATGATIGNGQVTIHCLAAILWGVWLIERGETGYRELAGAALMLLALVKPSVTAPFFWLVLFRARSLRPAAAVIVGYVGLTLAGAAAQGRGPVELMADWFGNLEPEVSYSAIKGYNTLHQWGHLLGIDRWIALLSVSVLFALGAWVWWRRRADLLVVTGVVALVARLWTYHNWYDDLLLVVPMAALFRVARSRSIGPRWRTAAGSLLGLMVVFHIAPGGHFVLPPVPKTVYLAFQALLWLTTLVTLIACAQGLAGSAFVDRVNPEQAHRGRPARADGG
jgi:hypothetical protein